MKTAYKYRAYPSKEQRGTLNRQMYLSKELYNLLLEKLQYKAESAGCVAMKVNPQYTSMTCSKCGNVQSISISQRTFVCEKCGMSMDRDVNAAQNILKRALDSISPTTEGHSGSQACRDDIRPSAGEAVAYEAGTIWVAS